MQTKLQSLRYVLALLLFVGCDTYDKQQEGLPDTALLKVATRSLSPSAEVSDLYLWAYACDADGHVVLDTPAASVSSESSDAVLQIIPDSRYYFLVAVANADKDAADITFSALSSTTVSMQDEDLASHWSVVEVMSEGSLLPETEVSMELFRPYGKVTVSIAKSSSSMSLLITDVSVCSASAPSEGALLSCLTPDQIKTGGAGADQWWDEGFAPDQDAFAERLAENIEITETGTYVSAGSTLLFENRSGWTDLTAFAEDNFSADPSESGNGYYLSVGYRYTVYPGVSPAEDSDKVIGVRKYVPLAPVCRSNEYSIKVSVDMSSIVVTGSTEVSEETVGAW